MSHETGEARPMQLDMLAQFAPPEAEAALPPSPWPPALVVESYGTAGYWRIRCSMPGHDAEFGMWRIDNRRAAEKAAQDHRWWHDTDGGRLVVWPGHCTGATPDGPCGWSEDDHTAREPAWLQPNVHAARMGAYRGRTPVWHAFTTEAS